MSGKNVLSGSVDHCNPAEWPIFYVIFDQHISALEAGRRFRAALVQGYLFPARARLMRKAAYTFRKIITAPNAKQAGQPATSSVCLAGQISVPVRRRLSRWPDAVMLAVAINPSRKQARLLDKYAGRGGAVVRHRLGFGHVTAMKRPVLCTITGTKYRANDFTDSAPRPEISTDAAHAGGQF